MKQYGFVYNNFEKMQSFICNKKINKADNILVQVFTGVINTEFIEKITGEILSILPQAEIIGATTGGEIFKRRYLVNSTVISITVFEKTKVKSKLLKTNNNEYESGMNIAKELVEEDTKALILFSEALLTNCSEILRGIESINNKIIVCGGKAGDNGLLKETFVFTKEGISRCGVAVVSLTGKQLNIITDYSFGWSTIGKQMTITKASNNRIYTIDNVKVTDVYRKYLGDEVAEGLPTSAVNFPLIEVEDGVQVAKVPLAVNDDGSLSFLSNVEVNDKVKFGYGNVNMLIDQFTEIHDRLMKKDIEALFVYSCYTRSSFIRGKISSNMFFLSDIAPTFGFYTYGEIFTMNNTNKMLNIVMTVVGISEGEYRPHNKVKQKNVKSQKPVKKFFDGENLNITKAFTNLVDESTRELQEANEVLKEQKRKAEKMSSITQSILQINSAMISPFEFDKFIQMMLDKIIDAVGKGEMGSILLVENGKFYYKAYKGYALNNVNDISYNIENLYKYNVNKNNLFNPVIFKDVYKESFFKLGNIRPWKDLLSKKPKELLSCCIGVDGKIAGLVNIFNTENEDDFSDDDKSMLKYICYDIALAIKNFSLIGDIVHMSRYDSLTRIYNRSYFWQLLNEIIKQSKSLGTTFIACGIDLNDFKIINDTYGHDKGDEALAKFASVFKTEVDKDDIFGRSGGDEFVVIFVNKSKEQVMETLNRINMKLKDYSLEINGDTYNISFAYGLAEFPNDSEDIKELFKIADKKMYERKKMMKSSSD